MVDESKQGFFFLVRGNKNKNKIYFTVYAGGGKNKKMPLGIEVSPSPGFMYLRAHSASCD